MESRFSGAADHSRSSIVQTKTELRDELARTKEQLANELARTQDCNRRIADLEQEATSVKEQLRDTHAHVRNMHAEKQRLEKQMQTMRARTSDTQPSSLAEAGEWLSKATGLSTSVPAPGGGLRELKLGRSKSTPSQGQSGFIKRASTLTLKTDGRESAATVPMPHTAPVGEQEALLRNSAQSKTAEAVAKQEAEEARQKLENLRKAFGLAPGDIPPAAHNSTLCINSRLTSVGGGNGCYGHAQPLYRVEYGVGTRSNGPGSTSSTSSASPCRGCRTCRLLLPRAAGSGGGGDDQDEQQQAVPHERVKH